MTETRLSGMEISQISSNDLEVAFAAVLAEHKDAVNSIHQSMVEAAEAYEKYLDEDYEPQEDQAKKDRADLNRAEKNIAERFASLKSAYERPLEQFEIDVRRIRNQIKNASGIVDSTVKAHDEKRKNKKQEEIQAYFNTKNFNLVSLDRIFDPKWLNKGTLMKDIREKIDEDVNGIYQDIEVLERIPEYNQIAKAIYLTTLDMGAALRKVDELKGNAERLAKEQAQRELRKNQEQVERNSVEERREVKAEEKVEEVHSLAMDALDLPEPEVEKPEELIEYTLRVKGTREELLLLRKWMTLHGVSYVRVE